MLQCHVCVHCALQGYLEAKRARMDHLLDGSWCYWNHDGEPSQPSSSAFSKGGMGLPNGFATYSGRVAPMTVEDDGDDDGLG
eukprot:jgi/Chrzof1/6835/Cz02g00120.t1